MYVHCLRKPQVLGFFYHLELAACFMSSPRSLPPRSNSNLPILSSCDRLWLEWLVLGLNTVCIGLVLFLWHAESHWDGGHCSHFWWPSPCSGRGGCKTPRAPFSFSFFLMCLSKHPLLVRGPSKGQYAVTSQKLDSWLVTPRPGGGEEGHCAAARFLFVTFMWLFSAAATLTPLISLLGFFLIRLTPYLFLHNVAPLTLVMLPLVLSF